MRLLAWLFLVAATAPALADDTIADQAQQAYGLFAGGLSQQAFLSAQYGDGLFHGIAGNWVRLNGPSSSAGIETYGVDRDNFCVSQAALTLSSASRLGLRITTNLKGANFNQDYTLVAGSTFAEHTDPDAYLNAVNLGLDKTGPNVDQQRAVLLSLANGMVQIYRPSNDILVMTRDRGYPIVFARCPDVPTPAGAPASAASSSSAAQ